MADRDRRNRGLPNQEKRWPPPAFQQYAADLMASEGFMMATLAERGLLLAMQCYAWVNDSVPADRLQLARMLRADVMELERAYGDLVKSHFRPDPRDETRLISADLVLQKQNLAVRRRRLREAGQKGGRASQAREHNQESSQAGLGASLKPSEKRREEMKREEVLQDGNGIGKKAVVDPNDPFVKALGD